MNKLFLSFLAGLLALGGAVYAGTEADVNNAEFDLNMAKPGAMQKWRLGTSDQKHRVRYQKCTYSYAVSGGSSAAAISLLDEQGKACKLPKNAIVRDVLVDVLTSPTSSGSATIALSTGQTAADIKAALSYPAYTGLISGIPVGSSATAIKLTADRTPTITIATAPLTAGKVNVLIQYEMSQ